MDRDDYKIDSWELKKVTEIKVFLSIHGNKFFKKQRIIMSLSIKIITDKLIDIQGQWKTKNYYRSFYQNHNGQTDWHTRTMVP